MDTKDTGISKKELIGIGFLFLLSAAIYLFTHFVKNLIALTHVETSKIIEERRRVRENVYLGERLLRSGRERIFSEITLYMAIVIGSVLPIFMVMLLGNFLKNTANLTELTGHELLAIGAGLMGETVFELLLKRQQYKVINIIISNIGFFIMMGANFLFATVFFSPHDPLRILYISLALFACTVILGITVRLMKE